MVEVNLEQLAERVKCSLPTMRVWVNKYAAFPVIERGGVGKPWKFDAEAAIEFLRARQEAQLAENAERDEALAQLSLPMARQDKDGKEIGLDDQLKAVKLRTLRREEAVAERFLVPTQEVRTALERAFRRLGQAETSALDRVVKKHNLPEAMKRALEMEFADARTAFVRDVGEFLVKPDVDDEQFALQA